MLNRTTTKIDLPEIPPFDEDRASRVHVRLCAQARPKGALDRLERLAAQLAGIQASAHPSVTRIEALLFAGDHGMTRSGVSAYPAAVTAAMVQTLLAGRASANALADACDVALTIVDAGVDADLADRKLVSRKIGRGTRNAVTEPAMTVAEVKAALGAGIDLAQAAADRGCRVVILGEMGIGNSSSSALLIHRLAPAPLADCIGPGAGHDEEGLERKRAMLEQAAARTDASGPLETLCEFGGFEIAMMVGAALGAASRRSAILVDGFISTAAVLVAVRLCSAIAPFCVYAHKSGEPGHRVALDAVNGGAKPGHGGGVKAGQ